MIFVCKFEDWRLVDVLSDRSCACEDVLVDGWNMYTRFESFGERKSLVGLYGRYCAMDDPTRENPTRRTGEIFIVSKKLMVRVEMREN